MNGPRRTEQTGIDRVIRFFKNKEKKRRVLLVTVRTLLFFLMISPPPLVRGNNNDSELAVDLYAETNFPACSIECSRLLIENPRNETALILKALANKSMGVDTRDVLRNIADSPDFSNETATIARFELARSMWKSGQNTEAIQQFKKVFISTGNGNLFLRSGYSISLLIDETPGLTRQVEDIFSQIQTSSSLWTRQIIDECKISISKSKDSLTGKPVQWIITFYRSQISPAIGSRCSLTPSCSAYGLQALKKHGALGVAMISDRAIREPDVVAAKPSPVRTGNRWFYSDPIENHDWWIKTGERKSE